MIKILGKHSKLIFLISLSMTILLAFVAVWGGPYIVKKQIQKNIQLENSSQMFEKWKKLPVPLNFKVRVFNVTNPDEVNKGEKPKLAEIGPYVYKQYREKRILDYGENDTIRYMLKKTYFFDQEQSGSLSEDDEVTVINFSYLAAILAVEEIMPSFVGTVNQALEQFFEDLRDPFLRVKVRDLFFDGVSLNCSGDHSALGLVCGKIKSDMPQTMRPAEDGTGYFFSMFSHLNRTESGPYEVLRGRENIYELGHIVSYKNKTLLNTWRDPYCGQINGTDSSIFPPIDESNIAKRLYSFEPDICRSLYVEFVEERTIFNLSAYYYEIPESALAAKSANKDNKCFCKRNWSANHDGCLIMGVLNLAPCQGAPAIASFPHFYMASEELLEYFDGGVKPEREKHATFMYLDPLTGVVLSGAKRLQFNIELRNIKGIPQLENVQTGLFPLLWIEEGAEIPDSIAEELQSSHEVVKNVKRLPWILFAVFTVATAVIACVVLRMLPFFRKHANSVSFRLSSDANKVRT